VTEQARNGYAGLLRNYLQGFGLIGDSFVVPVYGQLPARPASSVIGCYQLLRHSKIVPSLRSMLKGSREVFLNILSLFS
jgi:hypothetical protein